MRARVLGSLLMFAIVLSACNDGVITGGLPASPTPSPTPSIVPTPTPIPCQFYGIDAQSNLWIIDPVAVTAAEIGPTGIVGITDIAITTDNEIIGITMDRAYSINSATGDATQISATPWLAQQNALDALPDGRLLVGGDTALISVNPQTGAKTSEGSMGGGRVFSGDIATVTSTTALATGKNFTGGNDHLFSFNLATNSSQDEGDLGAPKVYGLDYGCDGELYGMIATSPPKLVRVDADTALTTPLGTMAGGPATLWGAAGPANP